MLGLYHDGSAGRWRWVDGSDLVINHTVGLPWNEGEPHASEVNAEEECAEITFPGRWSNTDCEREFSYVCEVQTSK